MNRWWQILIFTAFLGVANAQHFIKLVVLAALGLAGLWMVHTLANDFNHLNFNGLGGLGSGGAGAGDAKGTDDFRIYKRSIPNDAVRINWDFVLSRDPASCARSFICQLAAKKEDALNQHEAIILKLTRNSLSSESWAGKQLDEALKHGQQVSEPSQCMKIYKICPYSSDTMMRLLRLFGG